MSAPTFRITQSPVPLPSTYYLARRYSTLAAAVADMGQGVVWKDDEIVAFHERHALLLERKPQLLHRTR